jgi:hypothetical protein
MKLLSAFVILLAPLAIGVQAALANPGAGTTARYEARACIACPYGGSTEPTAHDCQAAGGYVVGTPDCNDGGCAALWTCVCCEWYR